MVNNLSLDKKAGTGILKMHPAPAGLLEALYNANFGRWALYGAFLS